MLYGLEKMGVARHEFTPACKVAVEDAFTPRAVHHRARSTRVELRVRARAGRAGARHRARGGGAGAGARREGEGSSWGRARAHRLGCFLF